MTFDFRYPTPLPSTKGWGPGWPNCQDAARAGEAIFWPGVHRQISELVGLLVDECEREGFRFLDPGCWGFGCRATKDAVGTQNDVPSFHSWGLGIDVNAPLNVFGADRSRTQLGQPEYAWFVALWKRYGFFWLGPDIKDWMHFHFCGSPADAALMTEKAREELRDMTTEQDIIQGSAAGREAPLGANPPAEKSAIWRWAFNEAQRIRKAETLPRPGEPAEHEHNIIGKAK